jgi:hypothetical protein
MTVFCDMTSYSLINMNRRFGGTFCLHLRIEEDSSHNYRHESLKCHEFLQLESALY